jgi:hypothetical protein
VASAAREKSRCQFSSLCSRQAVRHCWSTIQRLTSLRPGARPLRPGHPDHRRDRRHPGLRRSGEGPGDPGGLRLGLSMAVEFPTEVAG